VIAEARESQYAVPYLEYNDRVGYYNGLTPGSFLAGQGIGSMYRKGYENALINAMVRRMALGTVVSMRSKRGGIAYHSVVSDEQIFADYDAFVKKHEVAESIVALLLK
jgi:hypothetical protein